MKLPFFKRDKRKSLGKCPVCGKKVYEDDKYVQFMGYYIHKHCMSQLMKQAKRLGGRLRI